MSSEKLKANNLKSLSNTISDLFFTITLRNKFEHKILSFLDAGIIEISEKNLYLLIQDFSIKRTLLVTEISMSFKIRENTFSVLNSTEKLVKEKFHGFGKHKFKLAASELEVDDPIFYYTFSSLESFQQNTEQLKAFIKKHYNCSNLSNIEKSKVDIASVYSVS